MILELSENAQQDIVDFIKKTFIQTDAKLTKYISGLFDYIDMLTIFNHLGKTLFYIKNIEIRQLLFRKHRIIYCLEPNRIIILSVIHTHRDIHKSIKFLKNNLNSFKN